MKRCINSVALQQWIKKFNLQSYTTLNLMEISTIQTFKKGEHLIEINRPSNYLYFLVKGNVMIYSYSSDTKSICIDYAYPVSLLGEASSLWKELPKSGAKAQSDCTCIAISLYQYRQALQSDLLLLQTICKTLSQRLNADIMLANSLAEPVNTRLAKFILANEQQSIFSFKLTTCADRLNISYRHLLRTLKHFIKENILEKNNRSYKILDMDKLNKLAKQ